MAAACLLGVPRAAAADDVHCSPAAIVSGDQALITEVEDALLADGIDVAPPASCPSVSASLRTKEGNVLVEVTDASGRASQRIVANAGEAATVIESWARSDLDNDLLAGFTIEVPVPPPAPPPPPPPPVDPSAAQPVAEHAPSRRVALVATPAEADAHAAAPAHAPRSTTRGSRATVALGGDVAIDEQTSAWFGTSLDACARIGWSCIGVLGHLRTSLDGSRDDASALAAIHLSIRIGRFSVIPGIAVGAGRGASDQMTGNGNGDQQSSGWALRAEAGATLSYPLRRWLALDATLAADGAPIASGQTQDGESPVPLAFVRFGLGVRVEGP